MKKGMLSALCTLLLLTSVCMMPAMAAPDADLYVGSNQVGDTCYSPMGFSAAASENYAKIISKTANMLAQNGIRLFSVPGPTSVSMLPEEYRLRLSSGDQDAAAEYIATKTNDVVHNVNAFPVMWEHRDEYLYFHSDHHWTGLGAYYAYVAFCGEAGFDAVSLDQYERLDEGEFRGSYYPVAANGTLLGKDTMIAYRPYGNYLMRVQYRNGSKFLEFDSPVVDYSTLSIYDKYNTFIYGDNSFTDIENLDLPDDAPSALVIKDSFGNPFSVYLTQHYKHVYVVDYRHYPTTLSAFIKTTKIDDVIISQGFGVSQGFREQGILEYKLS